MRGDGGNGYMGVVPGGLQPWPLPDTHHSTCWWSLCLSVCPTTHPLGLSACLCCQMVGVPPSFPCIAGVLWSPVLGSAHRLGHVLVPSPTPSAPGCCPITRCMPAAGRWALRDQCTALGRALSLAALSRADGSRHMHFLTRSIGWE